MSKILVLQGPPANGKTVFARNFVQQNHHWVIVCRDSIRQSLGEYWVPEREELVSKIEYDTIVKSIEMGWNVIIDATNLNKKTIAKWEALADEMKCELEYKEFIIPFQEALERDNNVDRDHKVGYKVLYDFYKKYYPEKLDEKHWDNRYIKPLDPLKESCVICDLDGTICLRQNRDPYDYEKCDSDKSNDNVLAIVRALQDAGYKIIFLSGRENIGNAREKSLIWLNKHFNRDFLFFMRSKGDHRPDKIIKEELYHNEIEPLYNVLSVFDDRNQVVDMWRDLGILCCQVYYGDF